MRPLLHGVQYIQFDGPALCLLKRDGFWSKPAYLSCLASLGKRNVIVTEWCVTFQPPPPPLIYKSHLHLGQCCGRKGVGGLYRINHSSSRGVGGSMSMDLKA